MPPNPNYNELSAITEKYFVPKLVDNVFASNALFQRIKKGKMYELVTSGRSAVVPLAYATTSAAGRFSGSDVLDTSSNEQFTAAEFNWKQYYANITVTRADEIVNSGKHAIVNFVKSKVQIAEKTLSDLLGTDLFGTGSVANSIVGLEAMIAGSGTTYGGISKTAYSWWRGQTDAVTAALTLAAMRSLTGDCTIDSDKPSMYVTIQDFYDDLVNQMQPMQRFQDKETASAGFTNILYEGKPVVVDSHCGSSDLFALNEKYISLLAQKAENFRFEPFIKPTNQNISVAKIYWMGALTCSNPRMQGWMSNLS